MALKIKNVVEVAIQYVFKWTHIHPEIRIILVSEM